MLSCRADLLLSAQLRDQHTYGVFNPYDNPAYPSRELTHCMHVGWARIITWFFCINMPAHCHVCG